MGFVSSLLNNTGVIGKIASGVSKAANLISTVVPKISPVVNAITTGAKLAYQTGIADKLTGGKATRLVKGVQNMISTHRWQSYTACQRSSKHDQSTSRSSTKQCGSHTSSRINDWD